MKIVIKKAAQQELHQRTWNRPPTRNKIKLISPLKIGPFSKAKPGTLVGHLILLLRNITKILYIKDFSLFYDIQNDSINSPHFISLSFNHFTCLGQNMNFQVAFTFGFSYSEQEGLIIPKLHTHGLLHNTMDYK